MKALAFGLLGMALCSFASAELAFLPNTTGQSVLKFEATTGEYKGVIGAGFVGSGVRCVEMSPLDGYLYVGTVISGTGLIQRFDPYTGEYAGSLASGFLTNPRSIAFRNDGTLLVSDQRGTATCILAFTAATGEYRGIMASGFLGNTADPSLATSGSDVYAIGAGGTAIQKFDAYTGEYKGAIGSGFFSSGRGLDISPDGTLVLGTNNNVGLMKFRASDGAFQGIIGNGFVPQGLGLAVKADGTVLARSFSTGTSYICRLMADTGEYKGLFAANFNIAGIDVAVEQPALIFGNVELGDWSLGFNRPMVFEIIDPSTFTTLETINLTPDSAGDFEARTLLRGNYLLGIKASHWLRRVIGPISINRNGATVAMGMLINGDVDGDNEVGPGDFGQLATAFLSVDGDPNWNPEADLDGDAEVGPGDFSILANNFLQAGD